ncbi:MAG: LysR family transcriptional regulator [Gluconacetobacter diazotrophicus]|nr:LysR family transcriptional regulator [Gluconacetobacter diazotrophicus]
MDWDDVRFFLAVTRGGSVRGAAERLGVDHSTVLRRVSRLEGRLGARMFDRLPSGYRPTGAGQEVLALAEEMEAASHRLEARVLGRDQAVRGTLRVTMAPTLATHLLMPDLGAFARLHPEIEIDVHASDVPVNLTNRQADVALRVVFERTALPLNLHGWKGPALSSGVYVSRDLLFKWQADPERTPRWIAKAPDEGPDRAQDGAVPVGGIPFRAADAGAHLAALRAGIGMAALPCFVGDADPTLVRVPGTRLHPHGTLWVLTQGEFRRTRRVALFTRFIADRLAGHAALLAGQRPPDDR